MSKVEKRKGKKNISQKTDSSEKYRIGMSCECELWWYTIREIRFLSENHFTILSMNFI